MSLGLVACGGGGGEAETDTYTITFRQSGYEDVIETVEVGKTLDQSKIPLVQGSKTGYTVDWEIKDFSNVTSDTVVNVVETPKSYLLTAIADNGESESNIAVTYDQAYSITEPTKTGFEFVRWYNVDTDEDFAAIGTWTIDGNLTVKAEWKALPKTMTFMGIDLNNTPIDCYINFKTTEGGLYAEFYAGDKFTDFVPHKEGATFICWVDANGAEVDLSNYTVTEDITVTAKFADKATGQYVLAFIENGKAPVTVTLDADAVIEDSAIPATTETNDGYNVVWDFDKNAVVNTDTIIRVKYVPKTFKIYYRIEKESIEEFAADYSLSWDGEMYYQTVTYNEAYTVIDEIVHNNLLLDKFVIFGTETEFASGNQFMYTKDITISAVTSQKGEQEIADDDRQWSEVM